jgi:hypothetical protein
MDRDYTCEFADWECAIWRKFFVALASRQRFLDWAGEAKCASKMLALRNSLRCGAGYTAGYISW